MFGFEMSVDVLEEFFRRVRLLKEDTKEARTAILLELAEEGKMSRVFHTERTQEQFIKDASREHKVLDLTDLNKKGDGDIDAVWTKDSETGVEWLMDRDTNKRIAKRVNGKIVEGEDDESNSGC